MIGISDNKSTVSRNQSNPSDSHDAKHKETTTDNIYETIDNVLERSDSSPNSSVIDCGHTKDIDDDDDDDENYYEECFTPTENNLEWKFKTRNLIDDKKHTMSQHNISPSRDSDIPKQQMASDDAYEEIGHSFDTDKLNNVAISKKKATARKKEAFTQNNAISKPIEVATEDGSNLGAKNRKEKETNHKIDARPFLIKSHIENEHLYDELVDPSCSNLQHYPSSSVQIDQNCASSKFDLVQTAGSLHRDRQESPSETRKEFINALNRAKQKLEIVKQTYSRRETCQDKFANQSKHQQTQAQLKQQHQQDSTNLQQEAIGSGSHSLRKTVSLNELSHQLTELAATTASRKHRRASNSGRKQNSDDTMEVLYWNNGSAPPTSPGHLHYAGETITENSNSGYRHQRRGGGGLQPAAHFTRTTSYADLNQQTNQLIAQTVRPLREAASIWRSSSALSNLHPSQLQQQDATSTESHYYAPSVRSSASLGLSHSSHTLAANHRLQQQQPTQRGRQRKPNATNSTSSDDEMSPPDEDANANQSSAGSSSAKALVAGNAGAPLGSKQTMHRRVRRLSASRSMSRASTLNNPDNDYAVEVPTAAGRSSQQAPILLHQRLSRPMSRRPTSVSLSSSSTMRSAHSELDLNSGIGYYEHPTGWSASAFGMHNHRNYGAGFGNHQMVPQPHLPMCEKVDLTLLNPQVVPLSHELCQHVVDELQAISRYATRLHHRLQSAAGGGGWPALRGMLVRGMQNSMDILSAVPQNQSNLIHPQSSVPNQSNNQSLSSRLKLSQARSGRLSSASSLIDSSTSSSFNKSSQNKTDCESSNPKTHTSRSTRSTKSQSANVSIASGAEDTGRVSSSYRASSPDTSASNNGSSLTRQSTSNNASWNIDQVLEAYSDRLVRIVQERIADQQNSSPTSTFSSNKDEKEEPKRQIDKPTLNQSKNQANPIMPPSQSESNTPRQPVKQSLKFEL